MVHIILPTDGIPSISLCRDFRMGLPKLSIQSFIAACFVVCSGHTNQWQTSFDDIKDPTTIVHYVRREHVIGLWFVWIQRLLSFYYALWYLPFKFTYFPLLSEDSYFMHILIQVYFVLELNRISVFRSHFAWSAWSRHFAWSAWSRHLRT
jgi:hypothetical protein